MELEKKLYHQRLATASRSMNTVIHRSLCCILISVKFHVFVPSTLSIIIIVFGVVRVSYVIPMFSFSIHQLEEKAVK